MLITNIKNYIQRNLYLLGLVLIVLTVCIVNYTPGTWLTGWDSLHPEFNFSMNIYRSIFAVWQEYQGLGLLGGMGHASDLPRQILLLIASLIAPLNTLRYLYHFSMIVLGTIGVYKISKDFFLVNTENPKKGALIGALFYLLNLGTVQYFFVPFEPYSTFWGFLPWELYSMFLYTRFPSKKNLLFLALIHLAATAQSYVQTIFLVYVFCLVIFLITYVFTNRSRLSLGIATKAIMVVMAINSFWLLPNIYFTIIDSKVTQNSIHNRIDTEKFFQFNKKRGNITDFALLRESSYDLLDTDRVTGKTTYMLKAWRDHFSSPLTIILGYIFFGVILLGILRKNPYRPFIVGIFLLSAFALMSDTPPFSLANDLLRNIPLVNQIFRNPFSKFIAPSAFVFSLGFAMGITYLLSFFRNKRELIKNALYIGILSAILWYGLPAFQGQFISHELRVSIPQEYFDLFSYFKTQDKNSRIMNLPQGSYWGWGSYNWGLTGSGFLWYGIEQPITDRAFDVWSKNLEGYYWELWYSLKKKDIELFNQVLEKYQIAFIIYDPTYTPSDSNPFKILFEQQDFFLRNNPKIKLAKQFDRVFVYKTKLDSELTNNVLLKEQLPNITNPESFSNQDNAFGKLGYYESDKKESDYLFPFGSLFTNRFENEHGFSIDNTQSQISFSSPIQKGQYTLFYPAYDRAGTLIPVSISAKKEGNAVTLRFSSLPPHIKIAGKEISTPSLTEEVNIPIKTPSDSFIISANNQDFFLVSSINSNFSLIGTTYFINSDLENTIHVYSVKNSKVTTLSTQGFLPGKECSKENADTFAESHTESSFLVLQAKNTSTCSIYQEPLEELSGQSLLSLSFDYVSKSDEFPQYCFSDSDYSCINKKQGYADQNGFSPTAKKFREYFEIEKGINRAQLQFILDGKSLEDINRLKEIRYGNISLTAYPLIASFSPFSNDLNKNNPDIITKVDVPNNANIQIDLPKLDNSFVLSGLIAKNLYKKNPTTASNLPEMKEYHLQELPENILRVYAKDAYSQFWLKIPSLISDFGYLVETETRNLSGYPFILNISTPQDNNKYAYTILDKTLEFSKNHFILPPFYAFDKGMQILLMSSSFNRIPSVNDIKDISIYPIPYEYLTSIYLKRSNASESLPYFFEKPEGVKKYNPELYTVNLGTKQHGTIVFSQSFHPGWKAYETNFQFSIFNFQFAQAFPFLFGTELKNHVLVNNWENGWTVNNQTMKQSNNETIVIAYLPQYFEYLGFLLLTLTFLFLAVKLDKKD